MIFFYVQFFNILFLILMDRLITFYLLSSLRQYQVNVNLLDEAVLFIFKNIDPLYLFLQNMSYD